jgi:hypothetical protein
MSNSQRNNFMFLISEGKNDNAKIRTSMENRNQNSREECAPRTPTKYECRLCQQGARRPLFAAQ